MLRGALRNSHLLYVIFLLVSILALEGTKLSAGWNPKLLTPTKMTLADYLAKNYLTADSKPDKKSKKRKRKDGSTPGLTIADDDPTGWERNTGAPDEDGPLTGGSSCMIFLVLLACELTPYFLQ